MSVEIYTIWIRVRSLSSYIYSFYRLNINTKNSTNESNCEGDTRILLYISYNYVST
jgi:hypothetical protein